MQLGESRKKVAHKKIAGKAFRCELLQGMKLSRELAGMNLSLNYYTQWYWKIDLHNLIAEERLTRAGILEGNPPGTERRQSAKISSWRGVYKA